MQGRCSGLFCWTSKYTYSVVTGRLYYAICAFMAVVCHTSSKTICREKYLYITRLCICKLLALGMWLKTLYWKYCIMTTHISYKVYPEADEFKAVDKKYSFCFYWNVPENILNDTNPHLFPPHPLFYLIFIERQKIEVCEVWTRDINIKKIL